ncbi:DevR family CRISPR-associated autoregulator [Fibrella aquatilis]|uniref:DevR family CRISPR-associated autoregulator n=1 Tax=Fibrella aquatilis TaxID=2817059 RepID=A0A939GAW8_9BACT|nr:DevR family CRISPR-associated autoregulator [Fibrella aquatilis]MBO0933003.1 DevR family CRISPR-associated autoregulator [Fibrella aquatilis]
MNIKEIKHLSIVGELTINLASLNNEGTEGSATQPRTAVVVRDKKLYTVPAISGDMVKHWHAQHLATIAQERKLPLCTYAEGRYMNPNRLKGELSDRDWLIKRFPEAAKWSGDMKGKENSADKRSLENALYSLLASECVVTDAHGLLLTEVDNTGGTKEKPTGFKASVAVPRTGRVQFGIMAGIPEISHIQHYFHAKFVSARSGVQARENASNEGQNIFTRPASSAVFAFVSVIDLAGLGWDDAANAYAVSDEAERTKRKQAVIDAMSYTLMHQPGANTSQQFPHVMDFQGAIVLSTSRCPAPTVSPLMNGYQKTLEGLVGNINQMNGNQALSFHKVSGINETVSKLTQIAHGDKQVA